MLIYRVTKKEREKMEPKERKIKMLYVYMNYIDKYCKVEYSILLSTAFFFIQLALNFTVIFSCLSFYSVFHFSTFTRSLLLLLFTISSSLFVLPPLASISYIRYLLFYCYYYVSDFIYYCVFCVYI